MRFRRDGVYVSPVAHQRSKAGVEQVDLEEEANNQALRNLARSSAVSWDMRSRVVKAVTLTLTLLAIVGCGNRSAQARLAVEGPSEALVAECVAGQTPTGIIDSYWTRHLQATNRPLVRRRLVQLAVDPERPGVDAEPTGNRQDNQILVLPVSLCNGRAGSGANGRRKVADEAALDPDIRSGHRGESRAGWRTHPTRGHRADLGRKRVQMAKKACRATTQRRRVDEYGSLKWYRTRWISSCRQRRMLRGVQDA